VLASNAQRDMTTALNAAYNGNFLGCANHQPVPTTGGTWPFPDRFACAAETKRCALCPCRR
jgi:hypothetical protein